MPDQTTTEQASAASTDDAEVGIDEEVRDFAARFARLVISRAFRDGVGGGGRDGVGFATVPRPRSSHALSGDDGSSPGGASYGGRGALGIYTAEAELSLRGSQRLGEQLEKDANMLRSTVFPALLRNARQLHALYVAIDRVAEEVMPEVEATVKRMEEAVYDLEELRKEQVDTRAPQGSFGLGVALGAGLWSPRMKEEGVDIPEVFDTDKIFRVEEGGLAPL